MTRFVEISPFLQNLQSLVQISDGLFPIWEKFGPTLAHLYANGPVFIDVNG